MTFRAPWARHGKATQAFQQLFRSVGVDYTQPAQNLLDTLLKIGPALDTVSGGRIFGEEDFARLSGFFAKPICSDCRPLDS